MYSVAVIALLTMMIGCASIIESNIFSVMGGDAFHAASDYTAIQKMSRMSHNAHSVTGSATIT